MAIRASTPNINCFMKAEKCSSRILVSRQTLIFVIILQLILGSIPTTNSTGVTSRYTSTLSFGDPTFIRPDKTTGNYYYQTIQVTVSTGGSYTFSSSSTIDTFGCLYNNNFNPRNPSQNLLMTNDDGAPNRQFLLNANLQYGRTYFLVVTTFSEGIRGSFSVEANGPDRVALTYFVPYLTTSSMTTAVYSGALSTSSPIFTRPNGNSGDYFYQAIEVTVPVTGTYALSSDSSVDMYGCLYDYSFDPSYPNILLACNDDGGNRNGQFLISYRLEYSKKYILVVTTYSTYTTASYSINTNGPARPTLTSIRRTSSYPRRTTTSGSYSSFSRYQTWKIPVIIGSTIGGIGFFIIMIVVFIYLQKRNTTSNQIFNPSAPNQNTRAQNVPMRNMYLNATEQNRPPASYTVPMSTVNNTYLEPYPPSYDTYIASLKQPNQGNSGRF